MRVDNKQSVNSTDTGQSKPASDRATIRPQADKVSVDGSKQVEAMVQAVQANVGLTATAAFRNWKPPFGKVATSPTRANWRTRSFQAAEVDARLRAIFGG